MFCYYGPCLLLLALGQGDDDVGAAVFALDHVVGPNLTNDV